MKSTTTIECFVSKLCDLWVEGFDVLQSKMSDSKPTKEMMELLQANIKNQGKEYVTQWVKDFVLKRLIGDDICNIIEWQTGTPKYDGYYIVTSLLPNGLPCVSSMFRAGYHWYTPDGKRLSDPELVVAWFRLRDIKPYYPKNDTP